MVTIPPYPEAGALFLKAIMALKPSTIKAIA